MVKKVVFIAIILAAILALAGCEDYKPERDASGQAGAIEPVDGASPAGIRDGEFNPEDPDDVGDGSNPKSHADIRRLLEKGLKLYNLSYTAKFNSADNEYTYEYYRRDNLTKTITFDGESQSVYISDGKSTVYYILPAKTGYTMQDTGEDMGLVPSAEALLNEDIYMFLPMGEESISGYLCQVVETSDELGVLKIWISETLGLPIKYIGTDDNGWYSLELMDIRLGEPPEGVFAIPSDVVINR